eukprot:756605-Hanusia_phi.AAC.7
MGGVPDSVNDDTAGGVRGRERSGVGRVGVLEADPSVHHSGLACGRVQLAEPPGLSFRVSSLVGRPSSRPARVPGSPPPARVTQSLRTCGVRSIGGPSVSAAGRRCHPADHDHRSVPRPG